MSDLLSVCDIKNDVENILEIAKRYKLDLNHAKEIALDIQAKTRCLRKYFE